MVGSGLGGAVAMVVPGPMRMRRTREGGGPEAGEREPPRADSEGQAVGWFAGEHGGPGCGRDVGEGGGLQIPKSRPWVGSRVSMADRVAGETPEKGADCK